MSTDLNNALGVSNKYNLSYFRAWGDSSTTAVSGGMVYGIATPGNFEISGSALVILSNTSAYGTKILIKEAGLYLTTLTIRSSAGTGAASVGILQANNQGGNDNPGLTLNALAEITLTSTGARFSASGVAFLKPGQVLFISSGAITLAECTWQISKIGPSL